MAWIYFSKKPECLSTFYRSSWYNAINYAKKEERLWKTAKKAPAPLAFWPMLVQAEEYHTNPL